MRCCVPFCKNTSDNVSASERTEISFHGIPSEQNLRVAWLRALALQGHQLPYPAVVCSQHFLDDDFYNTKGCVRQIHSNAIPSTMKVCMICLDTDSKQVLMSKHKLEEPYQQLTGLSLRRRGNLKQSLCVLCAQRLINFNRFRDLCLSSYSLMTDLLEQHEFITIQHKEWMSYETDHLQCNLTHTTLGADHCDLYINHTEEEKQTAAEESVGDDAAVVVKNQDNSDFSNADKMEFVKREDDNDMDRYDDDHVPDDECFDRSIELESRLLDEAISQALQIRAAASCAPVAHVVQTESSLKSESATFECTLCLAEFVHENEYKEHMNMHVQSAACEASQVCEPRAAVGCSWDSLLLDNKTGSQRLNDDPPPAADCTQALVSARFVANNKNKLQTIEEAVAIQESEQILETNNGELYGQSSQISKLYPDFTYCSIQLQDILKNPNKAVINENPRVRRKSYTCDICNYTVARKDRLIKHMRIHTGEMPYTCELCNFQCAQERSLVVHIRTHIGEKPYSCDICQYKTARKYSLLRHKKSHTGEKPYSCETCNFKCIQKCELSKHKKTHTGVKFYSCDLCHYKTAQKCTLLRHMKTHTGEKPYSCDVCHYKTAQKCSLLRHKSIHSGEKPYACDICNYKCAQKYVLLLHKRTHTGVKPYSCELCNYKCTTKILLLKHERIHTGENSFSCDICDYKCTTKRLLLKHERIHTGENSFSCDICDYKCTTKRLLLKHARIHTGENSYSCDICDYKCTHKRLLLIHKKTHTREKSYVCEICGYKCALNGSLLKHMRKHTGEKPLSCEICDYKCALKYMLLLHIRTHTGEKPYSCEICDYKFSYKSNLLRHMRLIHTGTKRKK